MLYINNNTQTNMNVIVCPTHDHIREKGHTESQAGDQRKKLCFNLVNTALIISETLMKVTKLPLMPLW